METINKRTLKTIMRASDPGTIITIQTRVDQFFDLVSIEKPAPKKATKK